MEPAFVLGAASLASKELRVGQPVSDVITKEDGRYLQRERSVLTFPRTAYFLKEKEGHPGIAMYCIISS